MIDKLIGDIISLSNINRFSAVEIRTAYIAIKKDEQLDSAEVRRHVYEALLKLVKKGWLKTSTSKKRAITTYKKTKLFEPDYFLDLKSSEQHLPVVLNDSYEQAFSARLNQYNTELLEGLGAIKEYVALNAICPELHSSLKERYLTTQENNHILKGKIAALNELITSHKEI